MSRRQDFRVAALFAAVLAASCQEPSGASIDGGVLGDKELGESCESSFECASGICITAGAVGNVCTAECEEHDDCVGGPGWGCVSPHGYPRMVCGCWAESEFEICGDGIDNDCNGKADDCRDCDGVLTPDNHPDHCGACGNACREDQVCGRDGCDCDVDTTDCDGVCAFLESDDDHCGECGRACPGGLSCVDGECGCAFPGPRNYCEGVGCVTFSNNPLHCGSCNRACAPGEVCRNGLCTCPLETPDLCGDRCTDLNVDEQNCGVCGRSCPAAQQCAEGECVCPGESQTLCGDACVTLSADDQNCGSCGRSCPLAQYCAEGDCLCPDASQSLCGDACVALQSDPQNCGTCGQRCPAAQQCVSGSCVCPASGTSLCGGMCVNLMTDTRFCGACNVACGAGELCTGGSCVCPSGLTCGGTCMPVDDPQNCGACGHTCGPAQTCSGGQCLCNVAGQASCGADCADLETDVRHCGSCGNLCRNTEWCIDGGCRCPYDAVFCDGDQSCVDLGSDPRNCGACGVQCERTEVCRDGWCACPREGQEFCTSVDACVDTRSTDAHCGECDSPCHPDMVCSESACTCPQAGQLFCESMDTCVDVVSNDDHCGSCDNVCPAGSSCAAGQCVCATAGLTPCSGIGCVDIEVDPDHCGACFSTCEGEGRACLETSCACPAGIYAEPMDFPVSIASETDYLPMASDGSTVLFVYTFANEVYLHRLNVDGTELPPRVIVEEGEADHPLIAYGDGVFGIVYTRMSGGIRTVHLLRVDAEGDRVGDTVQVGQPYAFGAQVNLTYAPSSGFVISYNEDTRRVVRALGHDGSAPTTPAVFVNTRVPLGGLAVSPEGVAGALYFNGHLSSSTRFVRVPLDRSSAASTIDLSGGNLGRGTLIHDGVSWVASGREPMVGSTRTSILRHGSDLQFVHELGDGFESLRAHPALVAVGDEIWVAWHGFSGETAATFQRLRRSPMEASRLVPVDQPRSLEVASNWSPRSPHGLIAGPGAALYATGGGLGSGGTTRRTFPIALPECP